MTILTPPAFEWRGPTLHFGSVLANAGINLRVEPLRRCVPIATCET
jgi:hypothetical protein